MFFYDVSCADTSNFEERIGQKHYSRHLYQAEEKQRNTGSKQMPSNAGKEQQKQQTVWDSVLQIVIAAGNDQQYTYT